MNVVTAENLSKLYRVNDSRSNLLRDAIIGMFSSRRENENITQLWALQDVSFSVKEGETLGIIGRNGAGKSTLLKILSRITKPTHGFAEIKGRVGSLLEVGTGFHNELSGRENIYLNGAILGMRRTEIESRFSEIVEFSEIGQLLDTPVKHYSSGMYMRLAFSIAAHLEPEIIIVDEVLAVGDTEFQKKCLGKMDEVKKTGRTVIFVSHQLGSVAQLCQRSLLLEKGAVVMDGPTDLVIERYTNHGGARLASYTAEPSDAKREIYVQRAVTLNSSGAEQASFRHDEEILVNARCLANKMVRGAEFRMVIKDRRGITVFTADAELDSLSQATDAFEVVYTIPSNLLRPNNYSLTFALFVPHQHVMELKEDVITLTVFDAGSKYAQSESLDYGLVFSPCKTSVRRIE
jgi:lipopolysaccharide transport system ATP-binding protein